MVMPMGEFSLQMLEAPQVEASEMQAAVRWKIKDMLDYDLDQAVVDVFEIPGLKEQGRTPQVYAVFTHQDRVRSQVEYAESAGLQLEYVDIPELVQRNIASLLAEDEKGVALLRFNARSGLITLTQQGNLYLARSLDIGFESLCGLNATADSVGDTGLTMEPGLGGGVQHELDSVVLEIQRSLDYYESHFGKPPISNLVIARIEEEIVGLDEHIKTSLGLNVRMLDLNDVLQPYEPISREQQARCFYAIGAALREA
jgi:MSHA biogenesis protein MshI